MNRKTLSIMLVVSIITFNRVTAQQIVRYLDANFEKTENRDAIEFSLLLQPNGQSWQGIALDESEHKRFVGSFRDSDACIKEGPFVIYYQDGIKYVTGEYSGGLAVKTWKRYSPEGNMLTEMNFREGKLNGACRKFYPDGVLLETSYYNNNQLDSVCLRYHHNGQLAQRYVYQKDSVIERSCFIESGASAKCDDYAARLPVMTGPLQYNANKYFEIKRSEWKKLPEGHIFLAVVIQFDGTIDFYGIYRYKKTMSLPGFREYTVGFPSSMESVVNFDLIDEMKRRIYKLPKCIPGYKNNLAISMLASIEINILDN